MLYKPSLFIKIASNWTAYRYVRKKKRCIWDGKKTDLGLRHPADMTRPGAWRLKPMLRSESSIREKGFLHVLSSFSVFWKDKNEGKKKQEKSF